MAVFDRQEKPPREMRAIAAGLIVVMGLWLVIWVTGLQTADVVNLVLGVGIVLAIASAVALYQGRLIGWIGTLVFALIVLGHAIVTLVTGTPTRQELFGLLGAFALVGYLMANRSVYVADEPVEQDEP